MNEPVEIDWGPDGVTVKSAWDIYRDNVDEEQGKLRRAVVDLTHPKATPKQLARMAGMNVRTLYSFTAGTHILNRKHAEALTAAVRRIEGGAA